MDGRFSEAYEAQFAPLHRFLRRLGVRSADLEDVCHEVFLIFHRKIDRIAAGVSDRTFLFGIGARAAADYRRLARHRAVELDEATHAGASTEDLYRLRGDLERALDALHEDRRAVLVMHELEAMTAPEIADALGIPLNTVYSRLRLARADFERALSDEGAGDGDARGRREGGR